MSSTSDRSRVVVIGGGITGLAAAAAIGDAADVVVLEGASQVGGKLSLVEVAGVSVDGGAEAMLNRRPEALELTRWAGLGEEIVYPATVAANIWSRGAVRRMPPTVMGVPSDLDALAESGIVSPQAVARARLDRVLPASRIGGRDISVGDLVAERFGTEVVDRLVEPLLGGVYAGYARELSLRATVPQVVALLDRDRSLLKAASAAPRPTSDTPVFAGIDGGMGRLPLAMAAKLDVRRDSMVRALHREPDGRWLVTCGPVPDPRVIDADAVILAVPPPAAARLLRGVAPVAAAALADVEMASMAVVTLAFAAAEFPEVAGSGLLVPPVEGRTVKAATYSFAKWDWVREHGRRPDGDLLIMRTSIGRNRGERELQVDDDELVEASLRDLGDAIGLTARPVDWQVSRWGGALPQYAVGHLDRVASIRDAVAQVPGLSVAGAAYDGVGIPACIASARKAADQVLASLPAAVAAR
jgi:oxygen-dependent protoporphyrinogen oxidase